MSPIVQSLWIGSDLPLMQRISIQSFLDHGHDYHLYTYEEINSVPKGTTICDASIIFPRESIFCYQDGFGRGSYSAFSNLFRYKLLFEKGGWWVDTDVVCLRRFDFKDDYVFATEHQENYTTRVASCVIKSPPRSEYLAYCLEVCKGKNKAKIVWGEIGPSLMDEAINRFNLVKHCVPAHIFNPINYFEFNDILKSDFDVARLTNSYAVHLWHQMWKSNYFDPDDDGATNSLYGWLKRRYLESGALPIDSVTRLKRKVEFQKSCIEDLQSRMAAIQRKLTQAEKEREEWRHTFTNAEQEILGLQKSLVNTQREISQLRNSRSWKLTAPLRAAHDMLARTGLQSSRRARGRSS
jgi:hypothetical protein